MLHGQPVVQVKPRIATLSRNELLQGRTALITGGTSGIGKAIAEAFMNAGANVIITSRTAERAEKAAAELWEKCPTQSAMGIAMDNTDVESIKDAFAELTLAFNLLPNPSSPIGVAWFLGLIFLFYMIFPYFVFLMDNKRRAWLSLGLCYLFSFMAVDYFLTDRFINWEMTRHSIIYDAPFLGLGG